MGQKNRKAEAKNENEQALHNEALELDPGIGLCPAADSVSRSRRLVFGI